MSVKRNVVVTGTVVDNGAGTGNPVRAKEL